VVIRVVFSANRVYRPYLLTAIASVRHFLPAQQGLDITVLTTELSENELQAANFQHGDRLRCVTPPIGFGKRLPIRDGDHVTVETYYRLFLAAAFSDDVDRLIYLDSDLVVLADLSQLMNLDLAGKTVGAVLDYHAPNWGTVTCLRETGCASTPYFNAGVLVIDLAAWRRRQVSQRALEFLAANQSTVQYWDQDALNFALKGDWLELDPRWNRTSSFWEQRKAGSIPFEPEVAEALMDPYIVHFASGRKPWQSFFHPDRKIFDEYAKAAGQEACCMTLGKAIFRRITRYLP
jgi:lipopolysaccharide biosynthesis glycosyltransferase